MNPLLSLFAASGQDEPAGRFEQGAFGGGEHSFGSPRLQVRLRLHAHLRRRLHILVVHRDGRRNEDFPQKSDRLVHLNLPSKLEDYCI